MTSDRSAVMRAVKSRDTGPERAVRALLREIAPGYRLHRADLPGKPDIVYGRRKLAIFVHGCFWHGHDCARGRARAEDNADYWRAKIARNRARDAKTLALPRSAGARSSSTNARSRITLRSRPARDARARQLLAGADGRSRLCPSFSLRLILPQCSIAPASPTDAPDGLSAIDPERPSAADESEKDVPLRDDIRLLGRILGDTVREQEGDEVFELVERIRQASIRFHRDNEAGARRELEAMLDSLNADQTLAIVRAFSYFSHLANIAEDQHHIRRNRAHVFAGSAPRAGSLRLRACSARARRASTPAALARLLRPRAGQPGADRPSDRSAAQEHARPRARNRRAARRARAHGRRRRRSSSATRSSCAAPS